MTLRVIDDSDEINAAPWESRIAIIFLSVILVAAIYGLCACVTCTFHWYCLPLLVRLNQSQGSSSAMISQLMLFFGRIQKPSPSSVPRPVNRQSYVNFSVSSSPSFFKEFPLLDSPGPLDMSCFLNLFLPSPCHVKFSKLHLSLIFP